MLLARVFAAATVVADLLIVSVLFIWLLDLAGRRVDLERMYRYRLELLFLVSLGGSLGSLLLEYTAGWQPCMLCWYQRIFLYPQVLLTGTALLLEKEDVTDYLVPLNLVGGTVAVYHYLIQMIEKLSFGCSGLVECSSTYTFQFGYVTVPMMSLTVFAALLLLSLNLDG
ncbi:MAG: disulfide bond formation protein B [Candidatus Nanohaloarchaea archaeon]